jgi:cytochrome c oxidase subunit II
VLVVAAAVFLVVFGLLAYCVVKFRKRADDDGREPAQVYGSNQVELAWTVIPILIVVTLFLATARVIADIQNADRPGSPIEVIAIGHQFWWEYRFLGLNVVTAYELHILVSDPANPTPTYIKLLSADTDHSFWVPRLTGKTDLIPNRVNRIWSGILSARRQLSVTASEFQQRRAAMRRHKVSRRTDGTGYPNQRRHQALRECLDPAGSR